MRDYRYDADTNRTSSVRHDPAVGGACDPGSSGTTRSHSYDAADRLTDPGYLYDSFGRISSVPARDTGLMVGDMTQTYFADDRIRSISQNGISDSYTLDPNRRVQTEDVGGADATRTDHYADDSDSPAWIIEDVTGAHWTRNITNTTGDLAAIQDSITGIEFQLTNLHGDVVATAASDSTIPHLLKNNHYDDFGVPSADTLPSRYGWLGAKQRTASLPAGPILMGQRVYVPTLGRFLQTDPVSGGSANNYDYANQDPVTGFDLCGTLTTSCLRSCIYRYCGGHVGYFRVQHCLAEYRGALGAIGCFVKYCNPIGGFAGCVVGCITGGNGPKAPRLPRRKPRIHRACFFGVCVPDYYLLPFIG